MVKTVGRSFSWASPTVLNEMFCDDLDFFGLDYWYKDVQDQNREMEAKKPKK